MAGVHLGVDVGGTFTDFVLIDTVTGTIAREKCLTTPRDPVQGIMDGIGMLIARGALRAGGLDGVAHATTLVANMLIERAGAKVGLLATAGFRDLLEIGNDSRYDIYDLDIDFPPLLVPRDLRQSVAERTDASGNVLVVPDAQAVRATVARMVEEGVTSIAICFLHGYRNPANELAVEAIIASEFPSLEISRSSLVAPEIREYERTVTTTANAYVKPAVRSYLRRLETTLVEAGIRAPVLVMLSNGGRTTPRMVQQVPIRLVESGPAAGLLAACYFGERSNARDLLAFDMGGTTAKACFVDDGQPAFTGLFEAARVKRQFRGSGLPLRIPSIEIIEIGAGGGSIARVDHTGLLKVGPDSAGADPGPVCYGRGGTAPTVTDADLVLGNLDAEHFLGGRMRLDKAAAVAAIDRLAGALGLGGVETAAGIVEVVNQSMATAIRIHAAERGKDHRRYPLFAFGGAGPVHAFRVARILGVPRVICPFGAGTNSAFGLLAAPVAVDLARSYTTPLEEIDWHELNALFADMETEACAVLADAGVASPTVNRSVDMRFVGQGFELSVTVPSGTLGPASAQAIIAGFQARYFEVYASAPGDLPVEAVTWRLNVAGPRPELGVLSESLHRATRPGRTRPVYCQDRRDFVETAIFDRYALQPGDAIEGPAVLEEDESSIVVGVGGRVSIDADRNVVIDLQPLRPA